MPISEIEEKVKEFLERDDVELRNNHVLIVTNHTGMSIKDVIQIEIKQFHLEILFYARTSDKLLIFKIDNEDLYMLCYNKATSLLSAAFKNNPPDITKYLKQSTDTTDYTIKHDKDKPKLSMIPVEALNAVATVMDYGAKKYGGGTWDRVEAQRYIDAAARHLFAMQDKDEQGKECINLNKKDNESGLEHIKHLACNVIYAVAIYERSKNNEKEI